MCLLGFLFLFSHALVFGGASWEDKCRFKDSCSLTAPQVVGQQARLDYLLVWAPRGCPAPQLSDV